MAGSRRRGSLLATAHQVRPAGLQDLRCPGFYPRASFRLCCALPWTTVSKQGLHLALASSKIKVTEQKEWGREPGCSHGQFY